MPLTYADYIKWRELIRLQEPRSNPPEHDETLFIIIHQTYELWFRELIHEFEKICTNFSDGDLFGAMHTFKRARTILKVLVAQMDILETMTPMSFASFRDRLETASGFQSVQFRELEFLLGYKRPDILRHFSNDPESYAILERRLQARSVVDHFYDFLEKHDVVIPAELREKDVKTATVENISIQKSILKLYRKRQELTILFELMTDFDEGYLEWRYRHIKLVERSIGGKRGTGGLGVTFLKKSLFKPYFPDLWEIRNELG